MANLSNINNKFLVTTGGNVGIEVTGPTKKLDVYQSSTGFGVADFRHVNGNRILVNPSYNYYDAYNHIFRGLNGTDTHLTISNTGKATFGGDVSVTGGDLTLGTDSIASNINGVGDVLNINVDSNTGGGAGANIQLKTAGTTQLTINNSSSTFAGDIHLTDGKILGLRTSTNDYAIQYRDLDFRFIGSADGTTQRKFSFGYYTSDNPAGTWNSKVYINSYSGKVGIGIDPVYKLDVRGDRIRLNPNSDDFAALEIQNNTGSFYFGLDNTTGSAFGGANSARTIYSQGAYPMAFWTNNAERMRIDSSGNVGIKNTSPSDFDTWQRQLVVGNGTADAGITIYHGSGSGNQGAIVFADGNTGADRYRGSISYNGADEMKFYTSTLERMRINSSGQLLIETTTSQTTAKLGVRQNGSSIEFGHDNQSIGYYGTLGSTYSSGNPFIAFRCFNNQTIGGNNFATQGHKGNVIFSESNGDLVFAQATTTTSSSQSLTERIRLKNNGNIGIGTTSPSSKLTVSQGAADLTGVNNSIRIENHTSANASPSQIGNGIVFAQKWWSGSAALRVTGGIFGIKNASNGTFGGGLAFYTQPSSSADMAQRMVIDTSGKVGIGEDTPTAKLHLAVDSANDDTFHIFNGSVRTHLLASESTNGVIYMRSSANTNTVRINASGDSYFNGGKVGIGITSLDAKLQVSGSICSGTETDPTQISYDSNGKVNAFTHNFSEVKNTPAARNVTFVNVSGLGNFHQSFFYVQYGTRLQGVSDSTTGVVIRTYGVNRFNGGTLQVTETNAIAGSSNSLTHALVSVQIVSNTEYRLIVQFSSTLGASSFVSGEIKGYGVGDSFPTITFAEGASAN